jgi:hypothetical protein
MQLRPWMAIFEIVIGLFAWIWLLGAVSSVVLAGLALLADWSWWNVLYSAVASWIGKWLVPRLEVIRTHVLQGAAGPWPPVPQKVQMSADTFIAAYGDVLVKVSEDESGEYPADVYPQSLLPIEKEALRKLIELELGNTHDAEKIEKLEIGLVLLEDFVDDYDAESANRVAIRQAEFVAAAINLPIPGYSKDTGAFCPQDGGLLLQHGHTVDIVLYACSNYPACGFTIGRRPLLVLCPECEGLLVAAGRDRAHCTNCAYRGPVPDEEGPI